MTSMNVKVFNTTGAPVITASGAVVGGYESGTVTQGDVDANPGVLVPQPEPEPEPEPKPAPKPEKKAAPAAGPETEA